MIRPECLFLDRQRTLIEGLGSIVIANVVVIEIAKIVQNQGDVRMIRSQGFFSDSQHAQIGFLGPRNVAGVATIQT